MMIYGSISHGTFRTSDLLRAFTDTLAALNPERYTDIVREYRDIYDIAGGDDLADFDNALYDDDKLREDVAYLINEVLFDALDEVAPEGYYFGALEGDGSDFGFWEIPSDD